MAAELTDHVGYEKYDAEGDHSGNSRNGQSLIRSERGESPAVLLRIAGIYTDGIVNLT